MDNAHGTAYKPKNNALYRTRQKQGMYAVTLMAVTFLLYNAHTLNTRQFHTQRCRCPSEIPEQRFTNCDTVDYSLFSLEQLVVIG